MRTTSDRDLTFLIFRFDHRTTMFVGVFCISWSHCLGHHDGRHLIRDYGSPVRMYRSTGIKPWLTETVVLMFVRYTVATAEERWNGIANISCYFHLRWPEYASLGVHPRCDDQRENNAHSHFGLSIRTRCRNQNRKWRFALPRPVISMHIFAESFFAVNSVTCMLGRMQ